MTNDPIICDALCDLVPLAQFKKREKHPWKCVTFNKVAGNFTKSSTPLWVFFTFFSNFTNGTKSRKASHVEAVDLETSKS